VLSLSADHRKSSHTVAIRCHRCHHLGTEVGRVVLHFGAAYHNLRLDLCRILALVSLLLPRRPRRRARAPSAADLRYHRPLLVELTSAYCCRSPLVLSRSLSSGKSHYLACLHSLLVHQVVMRLDEILLHFTCLLPSQSLIAQASDALQQDRQPLRRHRCRRLVLALRAAYNYEDQRQRREVGRAAHHRKERTTQKQVKRQT